MINFKVSDFIKSSWSFWIFLINDYGSRWRSCNIQYLWSPYRISIDRVLLYPTQGKVVLVWLFWMEIYCLVDKKKQAKGDIIFGWRLILRYKLIWYLLSLLLLMIRVPFVACLLIVLNWCLVVPEGVLSLPKYLKGECIGSYFISYVAELRRFIV